MLSDLDADVKTALDTVLDPELDQPITDLGFVRSVAIDDDGITVHLRLPTAFCSPNFAYLMASDTMDALRSVDGIGQVRVLLDDHHDSDKINAGLAADIGYRGTFGAEADDSLDELRKTFHRKAHAAAMERCIGNALRRGLCAADDISRLTLRDLPEGREKAALLKRRFVLGLSMCANSRVLVDEDGHPLSQDSAPVRLRYARSVRVSIEGNAHFCRGLLATRYGEEHTKTTQFTNTRTRSHR